MRPFSYPNCLALALLVFIVTSSCKKQDLIPDSLVTTNTLTTQSSDTLKNVIPDINSDLVQDLRDVTIGTDIYKAGYVDQASIVKCQDSSWVCVFTTGPTGESLAGQHITSSRSTDLGKTWSKPVDIETQTGPMSSWAIPYVTAYGRVYVFYTYNGDNITQLNGTAITTALLGWYCYKYSDDMGKTWSGTRYRIPIKNTTVDLTNNWKGSTQIFWGICKPLHTDQGMVFSYTKCNNWSGPGNEGWLINCPNIETEKNAANLQWKSLPGNDALVGIKSPAYSIQEEHNIVQLNSGALYCVNRTDQGYPAFSVSTDFGNTWTTPAAMKYASGSATDRKFKNPRACPRIFKLRNGNYLLWYHNNNTTGFDYRNPVWVSGGVEVNGTIWWSEPEVLLFGVTHTDRYSYPDLIEQQGRYFAAETQKTLARLHELDATMLSGLWYQPSRKTFITKGLKTEYTTKNLTDNKADSTLFAPTTAKGGFTIDFMVTLNDLGTKYQIFSNVNAKNRGVQVYSTVNKTIALSINDGTSSITWETDQNLVAGTAHHVAFVADGVSGLITCMIDGKLCDGGTRSNFGWTWFTVGLTNLNTNSPVSLASGLKGSLTDLKVYSRALRTSELVSNYMAGK